MNISATLFVSPSPGRTGFAGGSAPAEATPSVFVIDEDVAVRGALETLGAEAGWEIETFSCAEDFLGRPRGSVPSCLLLDVGLADAKALEMQRQLADRPELPIIFLSRVADVRTVVTAMKAGAIEYLSKPLARGLLCGAIRHALECSKARLALHAALDVLRVRHASLSRREREVMAMVIRGRLNKQVAADLGISEITVKAHRGKMMRKMAARTVPDLVNMAAKLFPAA